MIFWDRFNESLSLLFFGLTLSSIVASVKLLSSSVSLRYQKIFWLPPLTQYSYFWFARLRYTWSVTQFYLERICLFQQTNPSDSRKIIRVFPFKCTVPLEMIAGSHTYGTNPAQFSHLTSLLALFKIFSSMIPYVSFVRYLFWYIAFQILPYFITVRSEFL